MKITEIKPISYSINIKMNNGIFVDFTLLLETSSLSTFKLVLDRKYEYLSLDALLNIIVNIFNDDNIKAESIKVPYSTGSKKETLVINKSKTNTLSDYYEEAARQIFIRKPEI